MQLYTTNPQVIHETLEGETIIIDLASGTYFSLQGVAPEIWNGLTAGQSDEQIVTGLQTRYTEDPAEIETAVATFLQTLMGEQLIAPSQDGAVPAQVAPIEASEQMPFVPPRLERYTDMQEIILLDPVHKVDSQGWPHAAPSAAEAP